MKVFLGVFGKEGVGKSNFVLQLVSNRFKGEYDLAMEDFYQKQLLVDEQYVTFDIWDTVAYPHDSSWWSHENAYRTCKIIFFIYSVNDRISFEEIDINFNRLLRFKDVDSYEHLYLIANKCDLDEREVSKEEGIKMAREIKASGYFEVSAKTGKNVPETFVTAAKKYFTPFQTTAEELEHVKHQLNSLSTIEKVLPWNWSKVYKWDKKLKKLRGLNMKLSNPVIEDIWDEMPPVEVTPSEVWSDLEEIFNNDTFPYDVIFICHDQPDRPIKCHKIILSLRSKQFKKLFQGDSKNKLIEKIKLGEWIKYDIMYELVKFCYNPLKLKSFESEQTYKQLSQLNDKYQVSFLSETIKRRLNGLTKEDSGSNSGLSSLMDSEQIKTEIEPGFKEFQFLSDIKFIVEGETFALHKVILAARSRWFAAMFAHSFDEKDKKEIEIKTMTIPIFKKVIEYLYTGKVEDVTPDIYIELMITSNSLNLRRLTQLCERSVSRLLDTDNVVAVYQAAEFHEAKDLIPVCFEIMAREYPKLVNSEYFQQLDSSVKESVKSKHDNYVSQLESCKKWIDLVGDLQIISWD